MSETDPARSLERVRASRRRGRLEDATARLVPLLESRPDDPDVRAEACRLAILTGDLEHARGLYGALERDGGTERLEPEAVLRLRLPEDGADPADLARISNLSVRLPHGHAMYDLDVECPRCAGGFVWTLRMSLVVDSRRCCPCCFGRLVVTFDTIRTFLVEHDPDLVADAVFEWEGPFRRPPDRLGDVCRPGVAPPRLATYLYQQYAFFLNQCLLRRLMERRR